MPEPKEEEEETGKGCGPGLKMVRLASAVPRLAEIRPKPALARMKSVML